MATLLILAYNEDRTIRELLENLYEYFEFIILVDDNSTDKTKNECEDYLRKKNFIYVKNEKNLGAGKSFELGLQIFNDLDTEFLVKIDGDNQFNLNDIKYLSSYGEEKKFDFIKCDRFWEKGIEGKIPFIRYLGNAVASILIKLSSGNWKFNDPLNGLFFMSKNVTNGFKLTKLFYRYGYPFYLVNYISSLSKENNFKIGQYQNVVIYGEEKSQLKANTMFFKLTYYTFKSYYKKIKLKFKYSELQFSGFADLFSQISLFFSFYSLYRFYIIGETSASAPRGSWFLLTILFSILFLCLIIVSQKLENNVESNRIIKISNYEKN